jgi:predicted unusual protein kinase regulating ubiquinone biosynthesis (AarF/ABC1/UbiB family)
VNPRNQSFRLLRLLRVLAAHGLALLLVRYGQRWPWLVNRFALARLTAPQRFRRLFEDLGGGFIKFGQMLALQPDIVSLEYCDELLNLLDRIPPFPVEHVNRVFVEELGRTPDQIFERFDAEPLATASIGQVHVAWLNGRKVAVKVQRPNVDTEFAGDIRLMTVGIRLIRRLEVKPFYWMIEPMREFVAWTREELEYRREARYADRLRRNAADNPDERVPEVFWDLTTRRTLVVEFMHGTTVLDYLRAVSADDQWTIYKLRADGFDPNRFARHIIDNFLGDAFRYGVFHADLHPANLLILPNDVVGYVDFGITGVLSRYSRRYLLAMSLAYTRADVNGLADAFFKLTSREPDADPERFRTELFETSQEWYEGEGTETIFKKNFTLVMLDMLTLSRKSGIRPERDVIKYIRSAIAADGLITRFAPGFNVGRYLEEVCQQWMTWEARHVTLRYDTLIGVAASSAHLAEDGLTRAASVLRRVTEGDSLARVDISTTARRGDRLRRRTLRVAGVAVAFTALFELTGAQPRLGVNLFTVEAVLIVVALVALGDSVRRLAVTAGGRRAEF